MVQVGSEVGVRLFGTFYNNCVGVLLNKPQNVVEITIFHVRCNVCGVIGGFFIIYHFTDHSVHIAPGRWLHCENMCVCQL